MTGPVAARHVEMTRGVTVGNGALGAVLGPKGGRHHATGHLTRIHEPGRRLPNSPVELPHTSKGMAGGPGMTSSAHRAVG